MVCLMYVLQWSASVACFAMVLSRFGRRCATVVALIMVCSVCSACVGLKCCGESVFAVKARTNVCAFCGEKLCSLMGLSGAFRMARSIQSLVQLSGACR